MFNNPEKFNQPKHLKVQQDIEHFHQPGDKEKLRHWLSSIDIQPSQVDSYKNQDGSIFYDQDRWQLRIFIRKNSNHTYFISILVSDRWGKTNFKDQILKLKDISQPQNLIDPNTNNNNEVAINVFFESVVDGKYKIELSG